MPALLAAADVLEEAACVVVAGEAADPRALELLSAALRAADPAVAVLRAWGSETLAAAHSAFGKTAGPGRGGGVRLPGWRLRFANRQRRCFSSGIGCAGLIWRAICYVARVVVPSRPSLQHEPETGRWTRAHRPERRRRPPPPIARSPSAARLPLWASSMATWEPARFTPTKPLPARLAAIPARRTPSACCRLSSGR